MRNEQYVVLEHYLDGLITGIQKLQASNMEVFNAVIGRLQEFKSSCDAKAAGAEYSSWTPTKVNLNLEKAKQEMNRQNNNSHNINENHLLS